MSTSPLPVFLLGRELLAERELGLLALAFLRREDVRVGVGEVARAAAFDRVGLGEAGVRRSGGLGRERFRGGDLTLDAVCESFAIKEE